MSSHLQTIHILYIKLSLMHQNNFYHLKLWYTQTLSAPISKLYVGVRFWNGNLHVMTQGFLPVDSLDRSSSSFFLSGSICKDEENNSQWPFPILKDQCVDAWDTSQGDGNKRSNTGKGHPLETDLACQFSIFRGEQTADPIKLIFMPSTVEICSKFQLSSVYHFLCIHDMYAY